MVQTLTQRRTGNRSAFTLLEVMIVVTIIAILAGMGTVYYLRYLDDANVTAARTKASAIATAMQSYQLKFGAYPDALNDLLTPRDGGKPFLDPSQLTDPWGRQFQFNAEGPHNNGLRPDVWSGGPDGQAQIGNWDMH